MILQPITNWIQQRPLLSVLIAVLVTAAAAASYSWMEVSHGHSSGKTEESHDGHDHAAPSESKEDGKDHDHSKDEPKRPKSKEGVPDAIPMNQTQIAQAGLAVEKAAPGQLTTLLELPGEIRFNADRMAHVVPRVAGVVEEVSADLGASMAQGQVMAVIASTQLAEQRSELLSAKKRLDLARTTYEREKSLWEQKVSPELDYLQARQAMNEAEIMVANAREKLAALGANTGSGEDKLNQFALRAPFAGTVVEKHLTRGEAVREDTQAFIVADLTTVWAEISVPAQELMRVRSGTEVTVRSTASGVSAKGIVTYVGALLGEQTRTAPARVVLRNPDLAWRPGLFVTVSIGLDTTEAAVTVLSAAIQNIEGKDSIFVSTPSGFVVRPVKLGRRDGDHVEVLEGVTAGEEYVARNSFVLKAELGKDSAEHAH